MNKSEKLFETLKSNRVIALLTPENTGQCLKSYEILNPLGITLEIAFRSEFAADGIKMIVEKYPEALLLAGTVMTEKSGARGYWSRRCRYCIRRFHSSRSRCLRGK